MSSSIHESKGRHSNERQRHNRQKDTMDEESGTKSFAVRQDNKNVTLAQVETQLISRVFHSTHYGPESTETPCIPIRFLIQPQPTTKPLTPS